MSTFDLILRQISVNGSSKLPLTKCLQAAFFYEASGYQTIILLSVLRIWLCIKPSNNRCIAIMHRSIGFLKLRGECTSL